MIELITGVPGAGKTLRAVEMLRQASLRNLQLIEKGQAPRALYSDIAGLELSGVLPAPEDWRDTPEGSLVVYDEAQRTYPGDAVRGVSKDERVRAMETHRHSGHDLVFITQHPTLVHHHIRKLVGKHTHHARAFGLESAQTFEWPHCCDKPGDRAEQARADSSRWTFPKGSYALYSSAQVHTHKRRIPAKVFAAAAGIAGILATSLYLFSQGSIIGAASAAPAAEKTESSAAALAPIASSATAAITQFVAPEPDLLDTAVPARVAVMGCIAALGRCQCWNTAGQPLVLNHTECRLRIDEPLPIELKPIGGGRD